MKTYLLRFSLVATLLSCFAVRAGTDMTTASGRVYRNANVLRVEPDGILVSYQLDRPAIALAKLKFSSLPENLRARYGYNAERASAYEAQQLQAMAQWLAQPTPGEWFKQYRAFAELQRSIAGDAATSYSTALDSNGKLSAQGFTGRPLLPSFPFYGEGLPANYALPGMNGAVTPPIAPVVPEGGY